MLLPVIEVIPERLGHLTSDVVSVAVIVVVFQILSGQKIDESYGTYCTWHDIFIITCLLICPIVNTQSPLKPGGFTNMYVWTEKSLILNLYRSKCLIFALQLERVL